MPHSIEYRILENSPGWYWEVIEGREVVARGVAPSQKDACAQAAEAERKAEAQRTRG
jgi:dsRNA-specific ribonuclease